MTESALLTREPRQNLASKHTELLLGCGHSRDKRVIPSGTSAPWQDLTTLDSNPRVKPDVLWDLNELPWPLASNAFDEVHAYEVLEHLGRQGDARAFFDHFSEIWRVLKPGGLLCASVPKYESRWMWADPSHTRAILPESLIFLDQSEYTRQLGGEKITPMSDFRGIYSADFTLRNGQEKGEMFFFVLQAVKPSR